jgi:hypothetical protein
VGVHRGKKVSTHSESWCGEHPDFPKWIEFSKKQQALEESSERWVVYKMPDQLTCAMGCTTPDYFCESDHGGGVTWVSEVKRAKMFLTEHGAKTAAKDLKQAPNMNRPHAISACKVDLSKLEGK